MEERDCKRKKMKKRESCEERSPLQCLNGLPIYKRNTKKSTNTSSSSAPNASRFLLSDNPCSSSRTHPDKKPKPFSRLARDDRNKSRSHASNVDPRYKENEMPRKPLLQRSRKEEPQFIAQRQIRPSNANPTCINRQKSKLSIQSKSEDKLGKGFQGKMKSSEENAAGKYAFEFNRASKGGNSNCGEDFTPIIGRVASGYGSPSLSCSDHELVTEDSVYKRDNVNANDNSSSDVKTPPIEASLSPEIELQTQPKMVVVKSVGTPICYGAGHLLSGVCDKRKSRRRGSLRGGPEKAPNARRDDNVSDDLQESSIPLLAEASIRWYLSPRGNHIVGSRNRLDQSRMLCNDDDLVALNLLSAPSMLCENSSHFLCDESRDNSLDDGNIIQTPDSGSSSDACFGRFKLDLHLSNSVLPELDPITEALERVKLSPRSEILMWEAPCLGSRSLDMGSPHISLDPTHLQTNVDSVSSWASDTTTGNLTLSQMRISWCDGLESKVVERDEFDCCCLSDDEIETCKVNEEDGFRIEKELSPVLLDYEPCRPSRRKGDSEFIRADACAESISTDGDGLAASNDSDWTCLQENNLFHATYRAL